MKDGFCWPLFPEARVTRSPELTTSSRSKISAGRTETFLCGALVRPQVELTCSSSARLAGSVTWLSASGDGTPAKPQPPLFLGSSSSDAHSERHTWDCFPCLGVQPRTHQGVCCHDSRGILLPNPLLPLQKPRENQNSQGFSIRLNLSTGRGCGRFFLSELWGDGVKEGRAVSEQSPQVTQSVGAHEEIYFLIARIVNHNCCWEVCQEESEWACRKEKEPFLQAEEEGRVGGRGEGSWGCTEGLSLERKLQLRKKDEIEGLHGAGVGSMVRKSGALARRERWIREEKLDEKACSNYWLFWNNSCRMQHLKTMLNVYYLAVCVGHSGVTELGASGLGLLMRLQLRYQQGLHHLKAWLGLEDLLPRWLTHVIDELVMAIDRRLLFSTHEASPKGCLSVFLAWQLVSPETVIQEPARQSCSHFCDLALEVIHVIFTVSWWLHSLTWSSEGLYKSMNARRWGSLEAMLEAGYNQEEMLSESWLCCHWVWWAG